MAKKYDLIVVGGGPGGLMAAKTAAEDGLKVLLIERKRNITEIHRTCSQIFYIRKLSPSKAGLHGDGYIESVSVEVDFETSRFHFPVPGFSLDYNGPLTPYLNWIEISPSGHRVYIRKNTLWGFQLSKESFVAELLASAQKAGAEVIQETIGMGAENTADGVKVLVRGKRGEQTLEARAAIAADGIASNIVENLGLNKKRQVLGPPMTLVGYELEGVESEFPPSTWVNTCMPSINRFMVIFMGQLADGKTQLTSGSEEVLHKFMEHPNFAPWFRHAQLVKKVGHTASIRTPIKEPVKGNVVVVGDAAAPIETWIQGAVAMAYMAVKAIEKELSGQRGYPEYIDWWQKAFYFHDPDYFWFCFKYFALANAWADDEEVDYIYSLFQDKEGWPIALIDKNRELIKERRPDFYEKLQKGYDETEKMLPEGSRRDLA
jgi:flavin-dependent dehydrogenase